MPASFEGDDPRLPGLERSSIIVPINKQKMQADREHFQNMLMGRIVDSAIFTEGEVQRYVAKYWKLLGPVAVQKINTLFLFHFTNQQQAQLLLEHGPWNIKGCLLVLKPWLPHTIFARVTFPTADLWVRVVNIPSVCYHKDLAIKIGSVLGVLLEVDWSARRCKHKDYFRLKVRIALEEPLFPGVFIPLMFQLESHLLNCDVRWLACKYERICHACYCCGRIGHDRNFCMESLSVVSESLRHRSAILNGPDILPTFVAAGVPMFEQFLRAYPNVDINQNSQIYILDSNHGLDLFHTSQEFSGISNDSGMYSSGGDTHYSSAESSASEDTPVDSPFSNEATKRVYLGKEPCTDVTMQVEPIGAGRESTPSCQKEERILAVPVNSKAKSRLSPDQSFLASNAPRSQQDLPPHNSFSGHTSSLAAILIVQRQNHFL
ncbi:hypothetical protein RJ639_012736 [Escallonia herrerae]|uniref:DUF4283 domain-containing protein n=1 Tax=Escallonia herrerae TaxID=1293975 RepID=A0AA88VRZ3_9ASTE|nr:hypothetical protein RJ639_012736 [Escallonia herrerae]